MTKYWVCKRAPAVAGEALECLGGNGYVEESGMPRLFRESPLNSIWEGSGNVIALDVLRALAREPAAGEAVWPRWTRPRGGDPRLDAAVSEPAGRPGPSRCPRPPAGRSPAARAGPPGSLLVRHAPAAVADAFCATRLGPDGPAGLFGLGVPDAGALVDRAAPTR